MPGLTGSALTVAPRVEPRPRARVVPSPCSSRKLTRARARPLSRATRDALARRHAAWIV
ncbi:MAG: hypothetical protein H6713_15830 [Myxococcales bacterium]|nr:hypothetical protein [Myxococcales bacterium]